MSEIIPEDLIEKIIEDMRFRKPRENNARAIVWRVLNAVIDGSLNKAVGLLWLKREMEATDD